MESNGGRGGSFWLHFHKQLFIDGANQWQLGQDFPELLFVLCQAIELDLIESGPILKIPALFGFPAL